MPKHDGQAIVARRTPQWRQLGQSVAAPAPQHDLVYVRYLGEK